MTTTDEKAVASVMAWLGEWEDAIASNDIPRGEALFAPEASGFGTVTLRTEGRADLIERQWREVWPRTREFAFERETMAVHVSPDARLASVQALWRSFSNDGDDVGRERNGRATIVLTRGGGDAPWRCTHTHFSMWPNMADLDIAGKIKD